MNLRLNKMIVLLFFVSACTNKLQVNQAPGDIIINSSYPIVPVLKGVDLNPVFRIGIYVPAGKKVNYRKLQCAINKDMVDELEKIQLFFTGTEPLFADKELIASPQPAEELAIPMNMALEAGWHYLWCSVQLKANANIDKKLNFRCVSLTDDAGKSYPVNGNMETKRLGVAIRKANDNNVNTYRIPGITTTDKGTLIAVYDVRYNNSGDLPGNIDVGMSRSTNGGQSWEPMKIIMDMGAPHENNGIGDPSILFDPVTHKIWVAALWSKGNRSIAGSGPGLSPDETGQFVLVSSNDDGVTWSAPVNITNQVKNPAWRLFFQGPGNGISMQNGRLVFPAQYWDSVKMPHSTIIYSDDHGITWKSGTGARSNTTESQVVETTPGTLMLNMRDNRGGFRSIATTTDLGKTWTEHSTSFHALPDPVCMASLLKTTIKTKEVLFFSNCNSSAGRFNITVKASPDLGNSWPAAAQLLIDERRTFGYSTLTRIDDNTIGLLYEGIRELYFVKIPVTEIIKL